MKTIDDRAENEGIGFLWFALLHRYDHCRGIHAKRTEYTIAMASGICPITADRIIISVFAPQLTS